MKLSIYFILLLWSLIFISCKSENTSDNSSMDMKDQDKEVIEFYFEINEDVYSKTDYGEAPQIAVWLENSDSTFYKTVFVTRRTGKNDWIGKVECPVSLPYWNIRSKDEQKQNVWNKIVDAVSGATLVGGKNSKSISVEKGKSWNFYIEVNASGDYNEEFQYWSKEGVPDTEGNGQPSIIYEGIIDSIGNSSVPIIIGRSDQFAAIDSLNSDISGITTARQLLSKIKVLKKL